MILLQLSASQGLDECALAVAKALRRLLQEAEQYQVDIEEIERVAGARAGTLNSVLLALDGEQALILAQRWVGSIQWICPSPYRPKHARKNWFIGGQLCAEPNAVTLGEIRYEACRASGPGGQHVNKTDSAIRATHSASGISVKVQSERSQHANKRLATLLIANKLAEQTQLALQQNRAQRRLQHHTVERGNPVRVFKGDGFEEA